LIFKLFKNQKNDVAGTGNGGDKNYRAGGAGPAALNRRSRTHGYNAQE